VCVSMLGSFVTIQVSFLTIQVSFDGAIMLGAKELDTEAVVKCVYVSL